MKSSHVATRENARLEIQLDGNWSLCGENPEGQRIGPIDAQVPGHVHPELLRAGLIPDPFWRDQAEQSQWVEKCYWDYERRFTLTPADLEHDRLVLEFKGLDTYAQIELNGELLAKTDNMFLEYRFEVQGRVVAGDNTLRVRFIPDRVVHADKDYSPYFACFSTDRVFSRRMQCSYGWDWSHRLVGAGIWRSVTLRGYYGARIEDVFIHTLACNAQQAQLEVQCELERFGLDRLRLELSIEDPQGASVHSETIEAEESATRAQLVLSHPALWFPNGYGEQPLYRLAVRVVRAEDGQVLDTRSVTFGIRTVEIEQLPQDVGATFTLKVNGERIFCKGGNWVPADPFPGTISTARYQRLIDQACRANINLLRCWGGGVYEPESFWDACDRNGVMVSQDFLLACAVYPEEFEPFMGQLRVEFEQAIRRLRNHASLAFWSGDNELGMNDAPTAQYPGRKISEEISGPLCAKLDPTRPYQPTSPYGGEINNAPEVGDCHRSAWYVKEFQLSEMRDYQQRIDELGGRFLSESAICGTPPPHVMRKFLSEEDLNDPRFAMIEYHTKDNPHNDMEDVTHFQMLKNTARNLFGERSSVDAWIATMEYVPYEWVRLTTEALRRQKFQCSGVQYWMFNDNWPASGWSILDYWTYAKAGFYATRKSFQPVIAAVERTDRDFAFWVCNDTLKPVAGRLRVRIFDWESQVLLERSVAFNTETNAAQIALRLEHTACPLLMAGQALLVAEIEGDFEAHRTWRFEGLPREMLFAPAHVTAQHTRGEASGRIKLKTDAYARVVTLAADVDFEDNYFELLPGEEREIGWSATHGAAPEKITLSWWNSEQGLVEL